MTDDTNSPPMEVNEDYAEAYSEESLWKKIAPVAIWVGKEILLKVLTLYYCLQDPDTPTKEKGIIMAALGYFIVPIDAIPDVLPAVGYSDDLGVLVLALAIVLVHIKPEHRQRADAKLAELLGEKGGSDQDAGTPSTPDSNR